MTEAIAPETEKELAATIAEAAAGKRALAVEGGGTRTGLGRPMQTAATLTTRNLSGVTLYEPTELVLSAGAGTPVSEIEALLAEHRQRLAFEPIDHRVLYGSSGEPSIGGVAAVNASGPRRIQAGAARDALIGVRAVNGRGEAIKSGGRVMKNVTGYDLVRFLAGSHGTLAVMAEVTFKVLPAPETEATLVLRGLDDATAVGALSAALGSPFSVTGAAHIPGTGDDSRTIIRIEGFAASVADRAGRLRGDLSRFEDAEIVEGEESERTWGEVRDLKPLVAAGSETPVWRVSVKPRQGPVVAEALRRAFECRMLFDWGGGLIWIAGGAGRDAGAASVRAAVNTAGGHATLVRAPDDVRNAVEVFQPQPPVLMDLSRRLKSAFDPDGTLNPGRINAGL